MVTMQIVLPEVRPFKREPAVDGVVVGQIVGARDGSIWRVLL
jgi:hypothetical protein